MTLWRNQFLQVNPYTRPGMKLKGVRKLVIHWTANPGASAQNHFNYFNSTAIQQQRYAGAHIFVDKTEAICIIPLDEVAYHANDVQQRNADGSPWRGVPELLPNANFLSIAVEMCVEKDGTFHPDTIARTEDIFVELCKRYNLDPIKDIVRHYDITHKDCPAPWVKDTQAFINFKNRVNAKLKGGSSVQNGWVKTDSKWYYYKNGVKQTGWIQDNGKWYYLDSNGVMQTGWIQDKGKWYFLADNGEMQTGWVNDKGNWYYLKENGELVTNTTVPVKVGKDGKVLFE
jgi:N-acetylmuramoyl-L-alanine amidase